MKKNSYTVRSAKEVKDYRAGKLVAQHIANRKDINIGSVAPDFTLPTADGKLVSLSSYRGKYVVLIFWASWCAPCRVKNEEYNQLFDKYNSKDVAFLGIALEKKEDMLKAAQEDKVKWLNVLIPQQFNHPILYQYGIMSVPHNVVIDKEGKIVEMDLNPFDGKTDESGKIHPSLSSLLKLL